MKKIIIYVFISIVLISIVLAFNPFENLANYFKLKYDNVEVIGDSTKYEIKSDHTAVDILIDGKDYTVFMADENYEDAVVVNYKAEADIRENERAIDRVKSRVDVIEDKLNVTDVTIPQEPETVLYNCSYKEARECLGGLSKKNKENISTRCYNIFKLGWSTCGGESEGWVLII